MTRLLQIQERLQETIATISRMESTLAKYPESPPSLHANIRSLQKVQKEFESEWLNAANQRGFDVCSYRLLVEESPKILSISKALTDFQELFSVMYTAIKQGPRKRVSHGKDVVQETSFNFGYAFPGSLGVVFTLPNDRLLPGMESDIDRVFSTITDLTHAKDHSAVSEYAQALGPAPIRAAYIWAKDHSRSEIGVSINWMRDQTVRKQLRAQAPEFGRLCSAIEVVGSDKQEKIVVTGIMVGADTTSRTFKMSVPELDYHIRGRYTDAISEDQAVTLPKIYTAHIQKTSIFQYSTGEEKVSYLLVRLEEP